jgi:hypothetical protein
MFDSGNSVSKKKSESYVRCKMNGNSPNAASEILQSEVQLDDGVSHESADASTSPPTVPLQKLDGFSMAQSIGVFILAGVSEIGGGWLMWKALRQDSPAWIGVIGGLVLAFYGSNTKYYTRACLCALCGLLHQWVWAN